MARERTNTVEREAPAGKRAGGLESARPLSEPRSPGAGLLLSLQQSAGNRAVGGFAQRWQSAEAALQGKFAPVQREGPEEEEPLQGRFAPVQLQESEDGELQLIAAPSAPAERQPEAVGRRNETGFPDGLKAGFESVSGISLDDVEVHYNSAEPARLNALAYAQSTEIHVAPGQEQHLPHEAWHVVQQAQGRVQPTMQLQDGVPVNDDQGLEHEADVMGARASSLITPSARAVLHLQGQIGNQALQRVMSAHAASAPRATPRVGSAPGSPVVQRQFEDEDKVAEDAVGFMRGPAERPETATPTQERVDESGLIDGEIGSNVQPHAFTDGGRVGEGTWHHCGGTGGVGVETLGAATVVAPVIKTSPRGKHGMAKAWIRHGTGTVKIKRSYRGVTHGVQGAYTQAPPGTVWMSPRARDRVDKHEREHVRKTEEIHDAHIKPLEERIDKYRGFFKAKKQATSRMEARDALKQEIDWNRAIWDFQDEDIAQNTPMGPVDTDDMQTADFYHDYTTTPRFHAQTGCDMYEGVGASKKGKT